MRPHDVTIHAVILKREEKTTTPLSQINIMVLTFEVMQHCAQQTVITEHRGATHGGVALSCSEGKRGDV